MRPERTNWVTFWAWRGYKNLFNKVAHTKDENGDLVFSKKRAAGMVLATMMAAAWTVNNGLPLAVHTAYDGAMLLNSKEATIYLNKAQEIFPEDDIHQTSGCFQYPCTDEDTMYFRIRDNIVLDLQSWYEHGHGYYPEDVAGVIENGTNYCKIKYYGIRNKTMGWYPYIYDAECTPVNIDLPEGAETKTGPQAAFVPTISAPAPQVTLG